jgi:MFS family permease
VPLLPFTGFLLSAYSITSGLSQFLGGWLGDRLGQRLIVVIGLSGVGLASVVIGLSSAYYPMLITLVIMGVLSGAYHPSAVPMLSSYYDVQRRGKVIGLHMVGGALGFTMGPILGGLIADGLEWRFAFILLGIPAIIAAPLAYRKFARRKVVIVAEQANRESTQNYTPVETTDRLASLGQVLRSIAIIVTLVIVTEFVAGTAMAYIPIYLVAKHNVTPTYAALLMGIVRGGGIAGSLFGGWLYDNWGGRKAIVLALVATGPILYVLTILPFNVFLMLALGIFGLVMIMKHAAAQSLLMDSTPSRFRATVFGIYFGLGMEGISLLQPVAGHFMDVFGPVEVFYFIALAGIALSVVTLLVIRILLR